MRTRIFFTLLGSLFISININYAQRIDFAINHQQEINITAPIDLQVANEDVFWVAYKGIYQNVSPQIFFSSLNKRGELISTHVYQGAENLNSLKLSITQVGFNIWEATYRPFGNQSYYTYNLNGATYGPGFVGGTSVLSYHQDSITSYCLDVTASRVAFISQSTDTIPRLRVAQIKPGVDIDNLTTINVKTDTYLWWPKAKWLNNNLLYLNTRPNASLFTFDDSLKLVETNSIIKCESQVMFKNKFVGLRKNIGVVDSLTSVSLIDSMGKTLWYFDCKQIKSPFYTLISSKDNLIAIHQKSELVQGVKLDSIVVNFFDVSLSKPIKVPVYFPYRIHSTNADFQSGNVVLLGFNGNELVIVSVTKNGVVSGVNESKLVDDLNVFPNPATNDIHVNTPKSAEYIYIYNSQGSLVHKQIATSTFSVSDLTSGLYLLEVADIQNRVLGRTRFVKH